MSSVVSIGCGEFVNCAGAFAAQVVEWCGDAVAPLPVAARRRTVFSVQSEPADAAPCASTTPLVVCPETGAYFRPDGATPGRFLCGVSPPKGWPDPNDHSVKKDTALICICMCVCMHVHAYQHGGETVGHRAFAARGERCSKPLSCGFGNLTIHSPPPPLLRCLLS